MYRACALSPLRSPVAGSTFLLHSMLHLLHSPQLLQVSIISVQIGPIQLLYRPLRLAVLVIVDKSVFFLPSHPLTLRSILHLPNCPNTSFSCRFEIPMNRLPTNKLIFIYINECWFLEPLFREVGPAGYSRQLLRNYEVRSPKKRENGLCSASASSSSAFISSAARGCTKSTGKLTQKQW